MQDILFLLRLEWLKVRQYRTFQVLVVMYLILMPGVLFAIQSIQSSSAEFNQMVKSYFMFPNIWKYVGYGGNWLSFYVLSFLAVLSITNEFSNRTLRQNIINGVSRESFFAAKAAYVVALSLAATLYYVLITLIFGFFKTETVYSSQMWLYADFTWRYFLICLSYSSLGLLFGMLLRKTGVALFLFLVYPLIELIFRNAVHKKILGTFGMDFYPMRATGELISVKEIAPDMIKTAAENAKMNMFMDVNTAAITTIIYIVMFFAATYYLLRTRDL
jgi:ABC-2 type transport system permease protein